MEEKGYTCIYIQWIFLIIIDLKTCDVLCSITQVKPDHSVWAHINVITNFEKIIIVRFNEIYKLTSPFDK